MENAVARATQDPIKAAILDRIRQEVNNKNINTEWLMERLTSILKWERKKGKRVPLSKSEVIQCIERKVSSYLQQLYRMSLPELKKFIKNGGDTGLQITISATPLTVLKGEPTTEQKFGEIEHMLTFLTQEQAWDFLSECNKWDSKSYYEEVARKAEKARQKKVNSGNKKTSDYITIPKDEATILVSEYYTNLASNASVTTPECFRSAELSNPTQHFGRFFYSTMFADKCDSPYNISEKVYNIWKGKEQKRSLEEAEQVINSYTSANEDHLKNMFAKLNGKSFLTAIMKKVKDKDTSTEQATTDTTTEQATTNTSGDMDDFMAELEEEMKKEQA